jgi:hypothetical protein
MSHTAVYGFERRVESVQLVMTGNASQWIDTVAYRSCFCVGVGSVLADWIIQAKLPNEASIVVGNYPRVDTNNDSVVDIATLFGSNSPRYITTNALSGLPIRFLSNFAQPVNASFWAIFKS